MVITKGERVMKKRKYLFYLIFLIPIFCRMSLTSAKAAWEQDKQGKWYSENNGYKKSCWFQDTDGKWYYFDANGYAKTGWFQDTNGKWYYFNSNGSMQTGWIQNTDGKYYYLNSSGEMASDTIIDGIYRLGTDGAWIEDSEKSQNIQKKQNLYTANDIKNKNLSSYTAGTNSIYGSELTQSELDEVAEAVAEFMNLLSSDLDTVEKTLMAHNYLAEHCSFVSKGKENHIDTAWGALVSYKASFSGYAKAMKALCDALDVNCYDVCSDDNVLHWNLVEVDGKWYVVNVPADVASNCFCSFLCGKNYNDGIYDKLSYDKANYPSLSEKGYDILPYYGKIPQSSDVMFLISASSSLRYPNASSTEEKNNQALTIAQKIADGITGNTDLEKVRKAAQIVSSYCYHDTYTMDGKDYRTAYGVFIKGEYSCAGATRALGMVLNCMGYSYEHINENQYTHQWCTLTMDGQKGYADGQVGLAGYGDHPEASD